MWPHLPGDAKDVFKGREIILFTAVKVNMQVGSPFPFTVKIQYLYNELDIKVLLKGHWVGYFHPKSCFSL